MPRGRAMPFWSGGCIRYMVLILTLIMGIPVVTFDMGPTRQPWPWPRVTPLASAGVVGRKPGHVHYM